MTRLPSALFFPVSMKYAALHHGNGVNPDDGWYLIDPASNLKGTQDRMRDWVQTAFDVWSGVVGEEPKTDVALKQIRTKDIYMYCGHGSGAIFIGKDDVQRDTIRSVCLLIGCSSGLLTCLGGSLEPWGRVLPFIVGCSPTVVGALWEVTDRDIDIFTQEILENWLKKTKASERIPLSSLSLLDNSTKGLKCKNANGRAVICYGIPIYRKK